MAQPNRAMEPTTAYAAARPGNFFLPMQNHDYAAQTAQDVYALDGHSSKPNPRRRHLYNAIRQAEEEQEGPPPIHQRLPLTFANRNIASLHETMTKRTEAALRQSQAAASNVEQVDNSDRCALNLSGLKRNDDEYPSDMPLADILADEEERKKQKEEQKYGRSNSILSIAEHIGKLIVQDGVPIEAAIQSDHLRVWASWGEYSIVTELPRHSSILRLKQWILYLWIRETRKQFDCEFQEFIESSPANITRSINLLNEDHLHFTADNDKEHIDQLDPENDTTKVTVVNDLDKLEEVTHEFKSSSRTRSPSSSRSISKARMKNIFRKTLAQDVLNEMVSRRLADSGEFHYEYANHDDSPQSTVDESILPTFPSSEEGYILYPSEDEIRSMEESDLAAVKDFCITRTGCGSILWLGRTDIRRLDLARMVKIESGDVYVMIENPSRMPPGTGINKLAQVMYFNVWPKTIDPGNSQSLHHAQTDEDLRLGKWRVPLSTRSYRERQELEEFQFLLRKTTKENIGGDFIDYDMETGSWNIQLPYFASP